MSEERLCVAMIGAGQLARMTAESANALGHTLRVLAADKNDSAAQVTPDVVIGDPNDIDALRRAAVGAQVVTFDHEQVPQDVLRQLAQDGVNMQPRPEALHYAQDKLLMRTHLSELGMPMPPFCAIENEADLESFWNDMNGKVVIKTATGGYDGHGVWMPDTLDEAKKIIVEPLASGIRLLGELKVTLKRELSAMVARSPEGQGAVWPVVHSVQEHGVCVEVIAPAPHLPSHVADSAQDLALRIAHELGVTGVLAVELFEVEGDVPGAQHGLLINELAMRPHNTGHWTQNGCLTSQFEQHFRAVLDYPMGDTRLTAPVTVMENVLGAPETPSISMDERCHYLFGRFPDVKVHLYGKGERPGRKLGHVNVVGALGGSIDDDAYVGEVLRKAQLAAHWLASGQWADGWDPHNPDASL